MSKSTSFTRRHFLKLSGTAGATAMLAACGPSGAPEASSSAEGASADMAQTATQSIPELLGADMPGSPDNPRGWTTVLPDLPEGLPPAPGQEPIEISTTRRVDAQTKFSEGDSLENYPFSRMVEKLFGVKLTVAWSWSSGDEATTKYNLAMASGDMPDYLETVPSHIFVKMVEANLLEDITDAFTMYASQRWQDNWAEYGELPWIFTTVNGRKYGLPRVEDLAHNDNILWYRQDWFDALGLGVPQTLDELHDTALAIVEADIGKGAPGTTIGLLANKSYSATWFGSIDPIWAPHGVVPRHWTEVGGELVFDSIRDEMREPLALLNQWYEDGIFREDFFTISTSDSIQDVAASTCGIHYTPSWGAWLDTVRNDPETVWAFADNPAGPDGVRARHTENNFRSSPFCFRKGMEHVDQIFTITNFMHELTEDYDRRFHGWESQNYEWLEDGSVAATGISWSPWAIGPIGTRGSGMIDPRHVANLIHYQLEEWGKIPAEERDAYQTLSLEDPTGVRILGKQSRLFILETAEQGKITQYQSLPTPTMIERGSDLNKLQEETLLGIIIGEKPLSAFDEFVDQWRSQGGDQMTQEVNEWWAAMS
ncbi:MAG: substrate-binding domain-containing protein [Caldilineaceae bacterium]|nr:substrate-binding domain-containing protein [Caldilineaceae bacterium]